MYHFIDKSSSTLSVACVLLVAFVCSGAFAEPLAGGWQLFSEFSTAELPETLQKGFAENFGLVGASYQPILYLGTQVVAGTNHLVLCRITLVTAEPVESFALVVVYEDLSGNVSIQSVNSVDLIPSLE